MVPKQEGEWVNKNPDLILLLSWGFKWPKSASSLEELTWTLGRDGHFLLQWSPDLASDYQM